MSQKLFKMSQTRLGKNELRVSSCTGTGNEWIVKAAFIFVFCFL